MIIKKIILVFKETAFYIGFIIYIVLIFLSFGLILIVFDYVKQENEYDDRTLMEEWERKEEKRLLEEKSINVSIWTPKIKKEKRG